MEKFRLLKHTIERKSQAAEGKETCALHILINSCPRHAIKSKSFDCPQSAHKLIDCVMTASVTLAHAGNPLDTSILKG